jgi:elongation factor 1 alpha-like protein
MQEGDVMICIPSKEPATVKSIFAQDQPTKWAVAGHNVVINLAGIDPTHLRYNFRLYV